MKLRILSILLMSVLFVPAWAVRFQNFDITAQDGKLCTMKKHRKIAVTPVVGDIVSLSASDDLCVATTADGQLYQSTDGKTWKMTDFNAQYSEYYGQVTVRCICASKAGLMLAGIVDGMPVAFESAEGNVWSQRELTYTQGNSVLTLQQLPIGLDYDGEHERFSMTCTGGVTFLMPGCSHCNSIVTQ